MKKIAFIIAVAIVMTFTIASLTSVFAADEDVAVLSAEEKTEQTEDSSKGTKAVAAAVVVAIAAGAGALGMAIAIGKSTESMARQPEAAGKINSAMMLGLVFIETAIIYALIVAILIIFVL